MQAPVRWLRDAPCASPVLQGAAVIPDGTLLNNVEAAVQEALKAVSRLLCDGSDIWNDPEWSRQGMSAGLHGAEFGRRARN